MVDAGGWDSSGADAVLLVVVLALGILGTKMDVFGFLLCGVMSGHAVEEGVT